MKIKISLFSFLLCLNTANTSELQYSPYLVDYENFLAVKPDNIKNGDPLKGKKIFVSRKVNCLSCHEAPIPEERFHGNLGPSLAGIGERYSKDEIRIRIIDARLINPSTIMPSYFKDVKFPRTEKKYLEKKILSAEEVEHLVEYLYSLK